MKAHRTHVGCAVLLGFLCLATVASDAQTPRGLILGPSDGEKRYYPGAGEAIILKVDPVNGASRHLVMETGTLQHGERIPVHRHLHVEEILYVQHGHVAVYLDGRRAGASDGFIIFIPESTWIGVQNVGSDPAKFIGVFNEPGFEQRQRLVTSTKSGGAGPVLSSKQMDALDEKYGVEYRPDVQIVLPAGR
jgi:quercetin dioxygenase-like cupin family protein